MLLQSVFKEKGIKRTGIIAARCKDLTLIMDGVEESTRSYAPAVTDCCHFEMLLCSTH